MKPIVAYIRVSTARWYRGSIRPTKLVLKGARKASMIVSPGTSTTSSTVPTDGLQISRVLLDRSGRELVAENADALHSPASLSKMMTLYLAFQSGIEGSTVVSEAASAVPGSRLGLQAGVRVSLLDLVLGMIVVSGNDAATALAEHYSPNFVELMNEKAIDMGLASTNFVTPSGVHRPGQVSTARDMAALAFRLYNDFANYRSLLSVGSFTFNGTHRRSTNTLLTKFPLTGIKTGTTNKKLRHLAASTNNLIGVVMGCPDKSVRDAQMIGLLTTAPDGAP